MFHQDLTKIISSTALVPVLHRIICVIVRKCHSARYISIAFHSQIKHTRGPKIWVNELKKNPFLNSEQIKSSISTKSQQQQKKSCLQLCQESSVQSSSIHKKNTLYSEFFIFLCVKKGRCVCILQIKYLKFHQMNGYPIRCQSHVRVS